MSKSMEHCADICPKGFDFFYLISVYEVVIGALWILRAFLIALTHLYTVVLYMTTALSILGGFMAISAWLL